MIETPGLSFARLGGLGNGGWRGALRVAQRQAPLKGEGHEGESFVTKTRDTFPIDGPRPPRLRPSEVRQRGPPPLGGWRRAAVHVEKRSGTRTFAVFSPKDCFADLWDI